MTDRVRALLITPAGELLTIRRIRPGEDTYWVLPGGGIDAGEDLETALARELHEEIAATADIHSLLHILELGGERQYFYLARVRAWSASPGDRSGPEFADAARGEYHLQTIPLTPQLLPPSISNPMQSQNFSSVACALARIYSPCPTSGPLRPAHSPAPD